MTSTLVENHGSAPVPVPGTNILIPPCSSIAIAATLAQVQTQFGGAAALRGLLGVISFRELPQTDPDAQSLALTAGGGIGDASATSLTNSGRSYETSTTAPDALAAGETVLLTPTAAREVQLSSSGVAFLCSMAAGTDGEIRRLRNVGSYSITLGHEEGASYGGAAAANCFHCPDSLPYVLRAGSRVEVLYRSSRWQVLGEARFARGGRLCPATAEEFQELTGFIPSRLYPCDAMGIATGQNLREVANSDLAIANAPLVDWRMGGYRGVQVTEAANGWKSDIASPAAGSAIHGAWFGFANGDGNVAGGIDLLIAGWVDTAAAARRSYLVIDGATKRPQYVLYDGVAGVKTAQAAKACNDSVVRLAIGQRDATASLSRCRVAGRGEAAVQSADLDITGVGSVDGGATPRNFVGATGLTGCTTKLFVGGYFEIFGATAAGATVPAKISHRLGME